MDSNRIYLNEWADRVCMSRAARRMGINIPDSPPPTHYTPANIQFALKLVAHREGGPPPESADSIPVVL